jgi:hypothetical protein
MPRPKNIDVELPVDNDPLAFHVTSLIECELILGVLLFRPFRSQEDFTAFSICAGDDSASSDAEYGVLCA